jgi:4-amino-4-deoxy-L-arabinose transferase-like glycosyltransferase
VTILAAVLRLSTLNVQSFWFDEAFTPVHVLHPSLWATLRGIGRTENTPPLWYLLAWGDSRVLGTGEIALRLPTALAGIATVPVAWAIGRELSGARTALVCAVFVAVNPLFVWYSQEARAYGLSVLTGALAMLCFLRLLKEPTRRRAWAFALTGSLALLSHYFTVFILIPMALWLLWERRTRKVALPVIAVIGLVGAALVPLVLAQGGQNTQWIGEWPLRQRLEAIPQYYLTGYSGGALGRRAELLVALPILAALAFGCWRMIGRARRHVGTVDGGVAAASAGPSRVLDAVERRSLVLTFSIAACGVLIPIVMVGAGADYLAPRNLVAAMIPVATLIALVTVWPGTGRVGIALAAAIALAGLAISVDVNLSPSLQRSNWRELAKTLRSGPPDRVITTVELGSAPLQYYLPGLRLHNLRTGGSALVRQIDETGYEPFRTSAGTPPAPGFHLLSHVQVDGVAVYRFVSPIPRRVSEAVLRRHVITVAGSEVLVPAGSHE